MKIAIIAPHMDDEVLGCGGIIAKHVERGDRVCVIIVAHRVYEHQYDKQRNDVEMSHALKAKEVLGYESIEFLGLPDERLDAAVQEIIIPLESLIREMQPETVFIPFSGDNNQDHRSVFHAARVVLRPSATPFIKNLYMYEVPSSTEQSPPLPENAFLPNFYVDVTNQIEKKLKALKCYETETRAHPHPRSEKSVAILAQKRGIEIGFEYAEAFAILRQKWE